LARQIFLNFLFIFYLIIFEKLTKFVKLWLAKGFLELEIVIISSLLKNMQQKDGMKD